MTMLVSGEAVRRDGGGEAESSFPLSAREIATWLLMAGIAMLFAGFTSAYIVLRGVPSWEHIPLPPLVWANALVLVASSVTLELSRRAVKAGMTQALKMWLATSTALGLVFVLGQFQAWRQMTASGFGMASTLHISFFYVFSGVHAVHILGGLIGMSIVLVHFYRGRLSATNFDSLRLLAKYWHFMGGIWLYLLLLLFFV
jgi:cytochrome c oxidase subunit 3